jgi:hypothetical protein
MKSINLFKSLSLIIMVSLCLSFISGCAALPVNYTPPLDGDMVPIRPQTVLYGIQLALEGKPGTEIWQSGSKYVVMWTEKYGAMLFTYDNSLKTAGLPLTKVLKTGGSLMNIKTADDLRQTMINSGFKTIDPNDAPEALKKAAENVKWLTALYGAETAITTLPTFIFMFVDFNMMCSTASPTLLDTELCADYTKS